jgi:hypothetical protein
MAKDYPLRIEAGATFTRQFRLTNKIDASLFDFTDYTAKVQIRHYPSTSLVLEVIPTIDIPTAVITLTFIATQTSTLVEDNYYWGMELYGPSQTIRLVEGKVAVTPEVVY